MAEQLEQIVDQGVLPVESSVILPFLTDADGTFVSREGPRWDFKESWPQSYSDSYFHGLCRLICAFANTNGGLIVFGVHDETRLAKKQRLAADLDRFAQAFEQLVGVVLNVDFRHYQARDGSHVAVMLVPTLGANDLPIRFTTASKHYPSEVIWVRQGHEVVAAGPKHIAQLYCRDVPSSNSTVEEVEGTLPPSPATIRQFVGRMSTIDRLFAWLKTSDQPRIFLHGKGGSGKSTIAFQVAKVLRESGAGFLIEGLDPLEILAHSHSVA